MKLHFVLAVVELHIFAVDGRAGEAIELRNIIDTEKITAVDFDDLPFDSRHRNLPAGKKAGADRA